MNVTQKIYFPFRDLGLLFEFEGEINYPDGIITLHDAKIDDDGIFLVGEKYLRSLEKNRQEDLYDAWVDWICKGHDL